MYIYICMYKACQAAPCMYMYVCMCVNMWACVRVWCVCVNIRLTGKRGLTSSSLFVNQTKLTKQSDHLVHTLANHHTYILSWLKRLQHPCIIINNIRIFNRLTIWWLQHPYIITTTNRIFNSLTILTTFVGMRMESEKCARNPEQFLTVWSSSSSSVGRMSRRLQTHLITIMIRIFHRLTAWSTLVGIPMKAEMRVRNPRTLLMIWTCSQILRNLIRLMTLAKRVCS